MTSAGQTRSQMPQPVHLPISMLSIMTLHSKNPPRASRVGGYPRAAVESVSWSNGFPLAREPQDGPRSRRGWRCGDTRLLAQGLPGALHHQFERGDLDAIPAALLGAVQRLVGL